MEKFIWQGGGISSFNGTNPIIILIQLLNSFRQISVETFKIYVIIIWTFIHIKSQIGACSITWSTAVEYENYMAPCYRVEYAMCDKIKK